MCLAGGLVRRMGLVATEASGKLRFAITPSGGQDHQRDENAQDSVEPVGRYAEATAWKVLGCSLSRVASPRTSFLGTGKPKA